MLPKTKVISHYWLTPSYSLAVVPHGIIAWFFCKS